MSLENLKTVIKNEGPFYELFLTQSKNGNPLIKDCEQAEITSPEEALELLFILTYMVDSEWNFHSKNWIFNKTLSIVASPENESVLLFRRPRKSPIDSFSISDSAKAWKFFQDCLKYSSEWCVTNKPA